MEDHSQGFVPDDVGFSNYMSGIDSAGWSETVGDEFNIPQNQPQDLNTHYAPPTQSQSIYNQSYGIPQNSYSNVSYNNPYHSHYQQGRSAPGYANASYTLDTPLPPELEELAFHRGWPSFEPSPNRTISPQNLHYGATTSRQSSQSASSQLPYSTAGMSASGIQNLPSFAFSQGQSPDYGYGDFTSNLQQHVNNGINFAPKRTLQTAPPQAAATSGQSFQQTESYNQWNSAFNNPQSQQHYPTDRVKTTEPNQLENTQPKGPPYLRFSGTVMAEKIDQLEIPAIPLPRSGRVLLPNLAKALQLQAKSNTQPTKRGRPRKDSTQATSGSKPMTSSAKAGEKRFGSRTDGSVKVASPAESISEEETDSEESDEEDEEDEEEMETIDDTLRSLDLGLVRPTGIVEGTRWDVIHIVWQPRISSPDSATISAALQEYGKYIMDLRTRLKANAKELEAAEKIPNNIVEANSIRDIGRDLLEALYQAIRIPVEDGHPAVVEVLGGHHSMVASLTTTLIECNKRNDHQGPLPKAVFALLAKFQTMTDDLLRRCKFEGLQKKWNKVGDAETKEHIESILHNTVDAQEKRAKAEEARKQKLLDEQKEKERLEQLRLRTENAMTTNSSKRPPEGDGSNGKPAKKSAAEGSTSKVAPKRSTNLLANNLLGTASKPSSKPVIPKRQEAPPTQSKLGALLSSIAKPPEAPKPPSPPPRAPETPEEQARRERKESRRHLRVKFKEGSDLVEIRLFRHEVAEDEGRDMDMLRDAHDNRSEGLMLKKGRQESEEAMDEADDSLNRPYTAPIEADFSGLEKNTRYGPTWITRGGNVEVKTSEQAIQQRREALELMVIYNDINEMPPTPKEPPVAETGILPEKHQIGQPTAPWLVQRLQEINHYGPEVAKQVSLSRMQEQQSRNFSASTPSMTFTPQSQSPATLSTPKYDMNNPLDAATAFANLQRIVDSIKGKPYPPIEPPEYMNAAQKADWWEGYYRDYPEKRPGQAASHPAPMMSSYQPVMQTPQMTMPTPQMSAPHMTPQMQHYPQMQSQPHLSYNVSAPVPDASQQVQAYLAAMTAYNAPNTANTSTPTTVNKDPDITSYPDFDFASWSKDPQGYTQRMHTLHQSQGRESSRKREFDRGRGRGRDWERAGDRDSDEDAPAGKRRRFNEHGEYIGKKLPCKFYSMGKCAKGDQCTFLHE